MFIQVQLFFIGLIAFFGEQCLTRPSKAHRRRHADLPTYTKLTQNVIPIIPSEYELPGIQFIQNKELLYPTNMDGQENFILLPTPRTEAKRDEEVLTSQKGVPALLGRERKALQRERKQPKQDESEPCGHFPKNDYNMLTNIIGKMSPEARNALIDALLKTLMEKSKVSSARSGDYKALHPLDAALQPPLRVNQKTDGPLVQPFSLTVEREKLRDLYKYLNNEKMRNGLKKTNVMINLGELLQETMKKDISSTNKPNCCHKHNTTKQAETEATPTEITVPPIQAENSDEMCNYGDQYSDGPPSSMVDFPGDRVINLTQIFNVHPKLLVVNAGQMAPTDIAGLLNEPAKTESQMTNTFATTTPTSTTTTTTTTTPSTTAVSTSTTTANQLCSSTPTPPAPPVATTVQTPAPHPPTRSMNNHRKCTRRQLCRHGYRYRYDRRGHISPVHDLIYTYYVDIDDLPTIEY